MPKLTNYNYFAGRHHETGTVHNYYAYTNAKAPHTNQPYSEALLLGVSGGIVFGYFSFAYKGYDPHVALLTRNTFNPLETMLSRLGVVQEIRQTSTPEKGVANLVDTLADGMPAMVWADMWSMPYNAMKYDEGMWGMMPLLVYGYDEEADQVWIADRSSVPLTVTTEELMTARARVKKDKFRLITLDQPDPEKLTAAVSAGIWDCINLFTEKPPKGSKKNFGFAAYNHWMDLLTKPNQRLSWAKEFPAGGKFYAGLTSAFDHMGATGILGDGDRLLYADFLDEAQILLEKPALSKAAKCFRSSAEAWQELGRTLLPAEIPLLGKSRELLTQKRQLFFDKGGDALTQINQINERLGTIRQTMDNDFPLTEDEVSELQQQIATAVQHVHDVELEGVDALKAAMS
ncbi:MAG: BtrH N-terminal domain-containing protein [Chloroflexota bacterium]